MSPIRSSKHEGAPKKRRRRNSKLAPFFNSVALLMLNNSKARASSRPVLTLEKMAEKLAQKHGVHVHASTLCRYLAKHQMLRLL